MRYRWQHRLAATAAGLIGASALLLPTVASAATTIHSFTTVPSSTQAGSHPDVGITFTLGNRQLAPEATACGCTEDSKNITTRLPTGLIGIPGAVPSCNVAQFAVDQCPVDSQLGIAETGLNTTPGTGPQSGVVSISPVFNLVPPPTEPALLGYKIGLTNSPVFEVVSSRTGSDYGVDTTVSNIDHVVPLTRIKEILWGVPADPVHDLLRFELGEGIPTDILGLTSDTLTCDANDVPSTTDPITAVRLCSAFNSNPVHSVGLHGPVPSNSPRTPFWQNPTTCGEASLATSLDILSYDGGLSHADSSWPATTDCYQLAFNPSQGISPTTTAADSSSGAEFRLTVPQFESPFTPSPSELRSAVVTLPPGYTLAPNVTNGKLTCSDAQAKFGTTEEAECPEYAKIGTVSVDTPVLPGVLNGAVYLGEPKPGNRFRIILAFDGFGVHVKFAGIVTPDPATGQLQVSFQNLPQVPFETFNLHIFGSERGSLATPSQCGTYPVKTVFSPWDAALPEVTSSQSFTVDHGPNGRPCPNGPRPFDPGFQAASAANTAGAHTAFSVELTRQDGDQNLKALNVTTPPGFSASLKGLTYCPEAAVAVAALQSRSGLSEQAEPSCPASSEVGEVIAGAGPGSHPLYLSGRAYLAGPYKGAPLSFIFITPAVSGGYDLGNVVVRAALQINPETAQVTAVSDPLPQVFEGIPLRLRSILINLNRKGFALNPTDCNPLEVKAQVFGAEDAISSASQYFQVANCASLPFRPSLSLRLSGSTKQAGNPALTAVLAARSGEANISRTQVTLPHTELIDNAHINGPCTRVQFAEGRNPGERCPPGSILGFARVETPLLADPLEGPIYLRSTGRAGLPDIVAALNGQIDIVLDGHVDSVGGRLRTTFQSVPDAPISRAVLSFDGGHKGLLENSPKLCSATQYVNIQMTGHNGMTANQKQVLSTPCGKHRHRRPSRGRARGAKGGRR